MPETDDLLLELQRAEGCPYLSDLHTDGCAVNEQILAIPPERFSLREWNDAASYITGIECHYLSAEEARESILDKKMIHKISCDNI